MSIEIMARNELRDCLESLEKEKPTNKKDFFDREEKIKNILDELGRRNAIVD